MRGKKVPLVPGFMLDENAIGPGQSNYQIAGKTRQTVCVINVGTRGSTSVTSGPSCARVRSLYQKPRCNYSTVSINLSNILAFI